MEAEDHLFAMHVAVQTYNSVLQSHAARGSAMVNRERSKGLDRKEDLQLLNELMHCGTRG